MEDLSSVVIFVIIAIVSLVSKLFNKKEELKEEHDFPEFFPSEEDDTELSETVPIQYQTAPPKKETTPRTEIKKPLKAEKPSAILNEEEEKENDFTIHSAEEARRAIIWGEILQRKYT